MSFENINKEKEKIAVKFKLYYRGISFYVFVVEYYFGFKFLLHYYNSVFVVLRVNGICYLTLEF